MFGLGLPELLLLVIIASVFLGFLVLVVAGMARILKFVGRDTNLKACPYCAEKIQAAAVLCRFCNRPIP